MKRWLLVSIAMTGLFIGSCGESSKITPPEDPTARLRELIAQTPRADEEAEMAALWMCGELVAPESTYVEVREGLKKVRQQFGAAIPRLRELKFRHEWSSRFVNPVLTAQGAADYRAGHHFEIDSLTVLLNGEIIDTAVHIYGNGFQVRIQFAGRLCIDSVEGKYLEVPTVASIAHYGWIGDSENVYPWRLSDGRLTLLFRDAWGDCENGCIENHFWYFRISGESVEYVGEYLPDFVSPPPEWWDEAKVGYEKFQGLR